MQVLVTGATGFIGSAVADALRAAGHRVIGLARSEESAAKLTARGIEVRRGDIAQPEAVAAAAKEADATIHAAFSFDPASGPADIALVPAILDALAGSGKTFVYTSGIWVQGDTQGAVATEESPLNPPPLVAWRPAIESAVLQASAERQVRGIVIRPGLVYGPGDTGVLFTMVQAARANGGVPFIFGDGQNHWTFVHVRDLADLYRRALEQAPAGSVYLGVSEPGVRVLDIAEAVRQAEGGKGDIVRLSPDESRAKAGPFADALLLDQKASSDKAKRELGWAPSAPSVGEELSATGSYAAASS